MVPFCGNGHGDLLVDTFDTIKSSQAIEMTVLAGCDFKYSSWVSKGRSICISIDILCLICLTCVIVFLLLLV